MSQPIVVPQQRARFYDGGDPGGDGVPAAPPDPGVDILVVLDRRARTRRGEDKEVFRLKRRIAYDDRHCGEIVVPPDYAEFESDLVSVPALFTWLVPKTGAHLPAALIHDGLIPDHPDDPPTYLSTTGKVIDRVEADRIFRDGMADTGVGLVRRWLVWTAVTLATMWSRQGTSSRAWVRTYYRWLAPVTLFSIAWLGYVATADLFDRTDSWWLTYDLRWMGDRPFWQELLTGAAGAIVLPVVVGLALWGTFRRAGVIAGVALGTLLHVTAAVLVLTGVYVALEWLAGHLPPFVLRAAAATIVAAAAIVLVGALR